MAFARIAYGVCCSSPQLCQLAFRPLVSPSVFSGYGGLSFIHMERPTMANSIALTRSSAFREQAALCIYCGAPMWSNSPEEYAQAHGISPADARRFQATAEHLKARASEGATAGAISCRSVFSVTRNGTGARQHERPTHIEHWACGKWHPAHLHSKVLSREHL